MQGMRGIQKARGKYICFVDSDDFIENVNIEVLYQLIKKYDADIAVGNYMNVQTIEDVMKQNLSIQENVYTGSEMIKNIYKEDIRIQATVTWNKLYDIQLFKNINFPFGKIHEDEFTTYKLYYNSSKVVMTSQILYYYRYVPTSIMNQTFSIKRLDIIQALEERLKFFKEKNEELFYNYTLINYEANLIYDYIYYKKELEEYKEIHQKLFEKFKQNYKNVMRLQECSKKNKIRFTLARISPQLYYNVSKLIKILKNR